MKSILKQLEGIFADALVAAFGEPGRGVDPLIRMSTDAKFGDYQSNVAMSLAKTLGRKPREVAEALITILIGGNATAAGAGSESSTAGGGSLANADGPTRAASLNEMCEKPEIAGPGFINLRLRAEWLNNQLAAIPAEPEGAIEEPTKDRLGIEPIPESERETVVIDYSSPNVAKQMHVGHLRSTIIGDSISRVLEFEDHKVIRQNHLGDWGTQFGYVIVGLLRHILPAIEKEVFLSLSAAAMPQDGNGASSEYRNYNTHKTLIDAFISFLSLLSIEHQENVYKETYQKLSGEYADIARAYTKLLQLGSEEVVSVWNIAAGGAIADCQILYERLGVRLKEKDLCPESFYRPLLPLLLNYLQEVQASGLLIRGATQGELRNDDGALCLFLKQTDGTPLFQGAEGKPLPLILQKSDGAYLYASTDLAAIAYRVFDEVNQSLPYNIVPLKLFLKSLPGLGAQRILYVVGNPQKLHFQMLFRTAELLGWLGPYARTGEVRLEHVSFGSVLGEDKKPLKTRSGENIKLKALLDEAVDKARSLVEENAAKREAAAEGKADADVPLTDEQKKTIAEVVGIGAVKYADLCQNRNSDYVFSWDKMLAMQGNTAPYLMYAYARIFSIKERGRKQGMIVDESQIDLEHPAELALGKRILQLPETIDAVSATLYPHILCEYLFDLAGRFMAFYENCPVLTAPDEATRGSRLRLCDLAARALRLGLDLLGIRVLERM